MDIKQRVKEMGLFQTTGHLDRRSYIIAELQTFGISLIGFSIIIFFVSLAIYAPFFSNLTPHMYLFVWSMRDVLSAIGNGEGILWIQITMVAYWAGCLFLHCNNSFKRLRDIRGSDQDELIWKIGVVIFSVIPYVNLVLAALLAAKEGVISSSTTAMPLARLFAQFVGGGPVDASAEIAKLYELKKTGAISETEFENMKKKFVS